jgi:methyltransferase
MIFAIVGLIVYAPMLAEARRAAVNERAQRGRGGIEPEGDVYPLMRIAYPASFMAMIVEGLVTGPVPGAAVAAGAIVFTAAKALKWWAILTLGEAWTFRVIVVPGGRRVASGPYRFLRHPNYVGVLGELAGIALMSGARVAGPLATLGFAVLILRRIAVESRALDAVLRRA